MATQAKATGPASDRPSQPQSEGGNKPGGEDSNKPGAKRQLVSFVVAGEEFGIGIRQVKEIIRPSQTTDLPDAPAFSDGIINFRGRLLPIVNLRARLGLGGQAEGEEPRIVVVETKGSPVGLLADGAEEVMEVQEGAIDPAPDLASSVKSGSVDSGVVSGVAKLGERLLILLDVEQLLSEEETNGCGEAVSNRSASDRAVSKTEGSSPRGG